MVVACGATALHVTRFSAEAEAIKTGDHRTELKNKQLVNTKKKANNMESRFARLLAHIHGAIAISRVFDLYMSPQGPPVENYICPHFRWWIITHL